MSFDFDYILLNIVLLVVYVFAGRNVSKGKSYWINAWGCILSFTFVLGSRYARGNDYLHYLDVYKYDLEDGQRLYTWICDFLKMIGINEYMSFYVYAFVFSLCLFVLLKRWKRDAKYFFPFSLIALIFFHEYMIRQEFSYAILFLYLNKLFEISFSKKTTPEKKKRRMNNHLLKNSYNIIVCIILATMAYSIHSANIIVIIIITAFYFFIKEPIHWAIAVPMTVCATYILPKLFDFSQINVILQFMGEQDEKFASYTDNSEAWFDEDAKNAIYTRNPLVGFIEIISNSAFMYIGYNVLKSRDDKCVNSLFNTYNLGIILIAVFRELELLYRVGYVMYIWWFVPFCIVLAAYFANKIKRSDTVNNKCHRINISTNPITLDGSSALIYQSQLTSKKIYKKKSKVPKWHLVFLLFFMYEYLKYLFVRGEMTLFLWDIANQIDVFR